MSKISFNRLINKKDKNFKIEPIFNGDKNTPLLEKFLKKQTFLNTEDVLSIIKINFLPYILIFDGFIFRFNYVAYKIH